MLVSIIIVNYRVKYFLEQTIRSAIEALGGIGDSGEIIVIDNNSGDGSIDFVKSRYGNCVTFIENKENVGFARANNQGIFRAKGEFTLILNPDTIIGSKTLKESIEWMRSHADCGGIGVRMLDGNGTFLPESKRSFTTPWVSFCKIFGLSALFPSSPLFAKYHLRYLPENEPHCVEILAGAYMLIRTDVLKSVGGFDEDFFMYGEDIDLSYRIVEAGYKNYYLPIPIIHYKGESTKKDSMRYVKVFYEAMLIFFKKHYPNYSRFFAFFIHFAIYARAAAAMLKRMFTAPFKPKNASKASDGRHWKILSDSPKQVARIIGCDCTSSDCLPTDIVIDDSCYSYQRIIECIDHMGNGKLRFHIYSAINDIIISPKMTLQ